ncbi:hypothetical protein Si089_01754 [Streptococcus infantarius subsp. infantarius]|nr:hypothetical protein [Streptococcus infantarius subsp. infantarius]
MYAEDYQGVKIFKKQAVWGGVSQYFEVKTDEEYVFSAYVKSSAKTDGVNFYLNHDSKQPKATGRVSLESVTNQDLVSFGLTDGYQQIVIKIKITSSGWIMPRVERYDTNAYLFFGGYKFEKGNTATPYSQAPEDLGWSNIPLVPTQTNRYLWKFEYIYRSDGSVEVTQPVNLSVAGQNGATGPQGPQGPQGIQGLQGPKGDQGIQGPKGADGKTQYTHIAYADNATGGGFSQTDQNKAYIGMYVDFTATDSTDPTKYKWSKWQGDKGETGAQGVPGPKGDDGKTPYLHIAYANSADGRTDFSTSNSGNKRYLGTYTDYTQADSTDPTKYKWVNMVGTVMVGGRNLIVKSTAQKGVRLGPSATPINDDNHVMTDWIKVEPSTVYVLTTYEDVNEANMYYSLTWYSANSADYSGWISRPTGAASAADLKGGKQYTSPANASYAKVSYPINYSKVKFERGNVSTDYSLALEDTQEQIDSKADQSLTQDQLNALAEKNNLIKAEMEAKASTDTVNQWITAYQNYVNANDADKSKSEQDLKNASERILGIRYEVNNLKYVWDAIDTYMSFQNEGLIIGKKDGSAYAKFSDDRISLFSGSSEVMYISQGTLNIANGIFTKTIQIGRFRFETHPADADMLVVRFVGG